MVGFKHVLRNTRMTTAILALVLASIVGSIAGVSWAIYASLHAQALSATLSQQKTNLAVAATILERRFYGSILHWTEDGSMTFQTRELPPLFYDTELVDSVTRVTGQDATIYVVEPSTQALEGKNTSLALADGSRVPDLVIEPGSTAYEAVAAGAAYVGALSVNGEEFLGAMQPVEKMNGEMAGAIFVGTPLALAEASANSIVSLIFGVGSVVTVALGLAGLIASRLITRSIPGLAASMEKIAEGNYDAEVPFTEWRNEVGVMARAVQVFRLNGLQVRQLTEAEAARIVADEESRKRMMGELQSAFGAVVNAAVEGDFSRRVDVEFPDPELNALAAGLNELVSTFDRGVTEIGVVLNAMANTDLTRRMEGEYAGALARLKADVNAVSDKLAAVVGQLRGTSWSLRTATGELLSGANDLSERTVRQATTIEETSAAMEQLAATVIRNAQRAEDASAGAMQVTRTAEEGGHVMDAANSAMDRITQSSSMISNIIGMIDDIAFQTNLLALNASVEAARAGDAGKGFAVVAVEVRRLAQSAAQASSEVKALIEQSAGDVDTGSRLVGEAADKLKTMLDAIRGNNRLLVSIAQDSREQASAIEQVVSSVRTMDEMTQHNAALVEQTNAAIEQTEAQAAELDRIVDIFRIELTKEDLARGQRSLRVIRAG